MSEEREVLEITEKNDLNEGITNEPTNEVSKSEDGESDVLEITEKNDLNEGITNEPTNDVSKSEEGESDVLEITEKNDLNEGIKNNSTNGASDSFKKSEEKESDVLEITENPDLNEGTSESIHKESTNEVSKIVDTTTGLKGLEESTNEFTNEVSGAKSTEEKATDEKDLEDAKDDSSLSNDDDSSDESLSSDFYDTSDDDLLSDDESDDESLPNSDSSYFEGLCDDEEAVGGYKLEECNLGDMNSPLEVSDEFLGSLKKNSLKRCRRTEVLNPYGILTIIKLKENLENEELKVLPNVFCEKEILTEKADRKPREMVRFYRLCKDENFRKLDRVIQVLKVGIVSNSRVERWHFLYPHYENGTPKELCNSRRALFEYKARRIFKSMCLAVKQLHDFGIAHLNVTPDNFLFVDDKWEEVIIRDLECHTRKERVVDHFDPRRTHRYFDPPEINDKFKKGLHDPKKSDIFSLGATLVYMLNWWLFPREFSQKLRRIDDIMMGYPFNLMSKDLKDLICKMIQISWQNRITIDEVLDHPWVKDELKVDNFSLKESILKSSFKDFNIIVENFEVIEKDNDLRRYICQSASNRSVFNEALELLIRIWREKTQKKEDEPVVPDVLDVPDEGKSIDKVKSLAKGIFLGVAVGSAVGFLVKFVMNKVKKK